MMDAVTTISSCVQRLDDCYPSITTKDVDMPHPSLWTSAWWQDALALQSILEADPSRAQQLCAEVADTELSPWLNVLETSNDDQLWWSSAWLTCYELTGRSSFLQRSEFLFSHTYQSWNASYCGGGILWDSSLTYKNAIANSLLVNSAMELFAATSHNHYLATATESANWFLNSGMIDENSLVVDGLTEDCRPTEDTYSYNNAILFQAFSAIYDVTSNATYAMYAEDLAKAATSHFTATDFPDILADDCCKDAESCDCNHDGIVFHAILARSLAKFSQIFPHNDLAIPKLLQNNADSMWAQRDPTNNQTTVAWFPSSPVDLDENSQCVAQIASLQLLNAAAQFDNT